MQCGVRLGSEHANLGRETTTHHLEVLFVSVGVRSVHHDRIESDSLLCEPERRVDVFLGRRVVQMNRDGNGCRVGEVEKEG
jgi:hypothetical protein